MCWSAFTNCVVGALRVCLFVFVCVASCGMRLADAPVLSSLCDCVLAASRMLLALVASCGPWCARVRGTWAQGWLVQGVAGAAGQGRMYQGVFGGPYCVVF